MPGKLWGSRNVSQLFADDDFLRTLSDEPQQLLFPHLEKYKNWQDKSFTRGNADIFLNLAKHYFGITQSLHKSRKASQLYSLDRLLVDPSFTFDQIWPQIELCNKEASANMLRHVRNYCSMADKSSEEEDSASESQVAAADVMDSQDAASSDTTDEEVLSEELEEDASPNPASGSANEYAELAGPSESVAATRSSHEKEKEKIAEQVAKIEGEIMGEKHWTLKGEVANSSRPVNSLLEENLEVDVSLKPPPVITEEVTKTLEDIIKQRIINDQFDDVERKVDVSHLLHQKFDPNKDAEIDSEKSQVSLAKVYEDQFLRETNQAQPTAKDKKLQAEHDSISQLFAKLCYQLDALSNYHFVPKPAFASLDVVTDGVAAIQMEEVTPLTVSEAQTMAPQQVFEPVRQKLAVKEELSKKEKKRLRAQSRQLKSKLYQRKQEQKDIYKKLHEKQQPLSALETKKYNKQVAQDDKAQALKLLSKQNNVTIINGAKGSRKR